MVAQRIPVRCIAWLDLWRGICALFAPVRDTNKKRRASKKIPAKHQTQAAGEKIMYRRCGVGIIRIQEEDQCREEVK